MSKSSRKFERKASLSICPEVSVGFFATYALPWSASGPQKLRSPTFRTTHLRAVSKTNWLLRALALVSESHINHLLSSLMVKNGEKRGFCHDPIPRGTWRLAKALSPRFGEAEVSWPLGALLQRVSLQLQPHQRLSHPSTMGVNEWPNTQKTYLRL